MGSKSELVQDGQRVRPDKSEVDRLLCDNGKAKRLMGWTPKVSLEEGLLRTIEWFERHSNRYKTEIYNI